MTAETHELKIWPEYFDDIESGRKPFEVRKLDRLFKTGDILHLREWSDTKCYSGRETKKKITYLMVGGKWGLSEGNCILGLESYAASQGSGLRWVTLGDGADRNENYPKQDGEYLVEMHTGSMNPRIIYTKARFVFYEGSSQRQHFQGEMDWNYALRWLCESSTSNEGEMIEFALWYAKEGYRICGNYIGEHSLFVKDNIYHKPADILQQFTNRDKKEKV